MWKEHWIMIEGIPVNIFLADFVVGGVQRGLCPPGWEVEGLHEARLDIEEVGFRLKFIEKLVSLYRNGLDGDTLRQQDLQYLAGGGDKTRLIE